MCPCWAIVGCEMPTQRLVLVVKDDLLFAFETLATVAASNPRLDVAFDVGLATRNAKVIGLFVQTKKLGMKS